MPRDNHKREHKRDDRRGRSRDHHSRKHDRERKGDKSRDRSRSRERDNHFSRNRQHNQLDNEDQTQQLDRGARVGPTFIMAPLIVSKCFEQIPDLLDAIYAERSEEGLNLIYNDSKLVDAHDIVDGSFVMVHQSLLRNGSRPKESVADQNFMFCKVIGRPGQLTRLHKIGKLYPSDANTGLEVAEFFSIETPYSFLSPRGANLMALEELLRIAGQASQASRRQVSSIPGNLLSDGVRGTPLITLDDEIKWYQDPKLVVARQVVLRFLWRTAGEKESVFAPDGTLLPSIFRSNLIEASTEEQRDGSQLADAPLLKNISHINLMKDESVFEAFLQGNFSGNTGGILSLVLFNVRLKDLPSRPTHDGKKQIAIAIEFLECALVAILSKLFKLCFSGVLLGLSGPIFSYRRAADDFMVHTMEKVLNGWGRVVRTQKRSLLFPEIDLKEPAGCAELLGAMMEQELNKISGLESFALDKEYRDILADGQDPKTKIDKSILSKDLAKGNSPIVMTNICSKWFAGGLSVKDSKGSRVKCSDNPCTRDHVRPSLVTKEAAISWAKASAMKSLRPDILDMIEKFKNFKK